MSNNYQSLTASNIKYLLVLRKLNQAEKGVRCVDMAEYLGISKPSVHTMMNNLKKIKLPEKGKYGVVYFTGLGKCIADLYSGYFESVYTYLREVLPEEANIKNIAYSILANTSIDTIETMCNENANRKRRSRDVSSTRKYS